MPHRPAHHRRISVRCPARARDAGHSLTLDLVHELAELRARVETAELRAERAELRLQLLRGLLVDALVREGGR